MSKWGNIREATDYYGIATHTLHRWRREGRLESREKPQGKRVAYEYELNSDLKDWIDEARVHDKRWR